MISERTIVVESNTSNIATTMMNSSSTRLNENFLDEGSLLLVKLDQQTVYSSSSVPTSTSSSSPSSNDTKENTNDTTDWKEQLLKSTSKEGNGSNSQVVIPLGKILEVFGPISKPLYTVRLLLSNITTTAATVTTNIETATNTPLNTEKDKMPSTQDEEKEESNQNNNASQADNDANNCNLVDDATTLQGESNGLKTTKEDKLYEDTDQETIIHNKGNDSQERKEEATSSTVETRTIIDPWCENGVLTKWIQSNPKLQVFYATNQVKFVDTQVVARNSRKGCGTL